jgi:flagellar P-ring protein precursor FlgI
VTWIFLLLFSLSDAHAVRTKDIGGFHGVRDNQLTGAGLVIGLRRTGDSPRNEAALRSLANRLQGLGASLNLDEISSRNVAMVMVSATLSADARMGGRMDVTVASTGDATSLEGGVLLSTPLMGFDGNVYAVGEGPLVVGGYDVFAAGNAARKNTPTVGRVSSGAIIEREVPSQINYEQLTDIDFVLDEPDFTTAVRLAKAVNANLGEQVAQAKTASTVSMQLPAAMHGRFPEFAAAVEDVSLDMDSSARVVINERTGTVVMGGDVTISAVAVAHGGLTIEVQRVNAVSQPNILSAGATVPFSNTAVVAEEATGTLQMVEGINIGTLVSALNDMGVKPRDLIVILQAIRSAGALHADIITQ